MTNRTQWVDAMRELRFTRGYVTAMNSTQSQECARAIEIAFLAASILRPKDEPCDSGKARSVLKNAMAETHSASWLTKIEKQVIMTCLIHAGNMLADVAKEQWIRLAEQIKDQAIKKEIER